MPLDAETKFTVAEIAEAAVQGHLVAQDKFLEAKLEGLNAKVEVVEAKVTSGLDQLETKIKTWGLYILGGQIIVGLTALGVSHFANTPMVEFGRSAMEAATSLIL